MMNFRALSPVLLMSVGLGMSITRPLAAAVTIDDGTLQSYVYHGDVANYAEWLGPADGAANAFFSDVFYTSVARTADGGGISVTHDQLRNGSYGDHTFGVASVLFTPDVDTAYLLSGGLVSSGLSYSGHYVLLFDQTIGVNLFEQADFAYGGLTTEIGVFSPNTVAGSGLTSGTLLAGHQYRFLTTLDLLAYPFADDGGSALGNATIRFTDPPTEVVPEPASIAVWFGLGLTGLCAARWRRHRAEIAG